MFRARRIFALVALALAFIAFPLGALASHAFADVPDSNPFHADISALAASGVTSGCGGGNFCPSANVTREQMAAFLNRLGALAPGKTPVVNADRLDGHHANGLVRTAYNATTALEEGTSDTATLSTSITTPGPGYLLIWGRASLYYTGATGKNVFCKLEVSNVAIQGAATWTSLAAGLGFTDDSCGVEGRRTVCSAAAFQVDYELTGLGTETQASDATILVQYVPFNAQGLPGDVDGACLPT